jgi:archaellum component FlaC
LSTSRLERENLEAHVDLCAERYRVLEDKLNKLDSSLEAVQRQLSEIADDTLREKASNNRMVLGAVGTIMAGLVSTIVILLTQA